MYHYIRLGISPQPSDALTIRKNISDALSQTFGLSSEGTYVDILSTPNNGKECVIRVQQNDVPRVLTSLVTYTGTCRFSLLKESPFLPSLLVETVV
ncbi:hypothetical protein AGABI2DRAFT_210273 [Agaricus bisporus var. bisporus H97]|uniref:hypothetical protein n=1 Tax=Agaricus bisporus var. bisporus (strain H97 / ATCC MYA-4626 / FGSC 10389) TaxID=936046 RepID=UPI00029F7926|nr:hypothetical protein AGABI2DRAFT_210273 [Agaricus bisporus var. bisporus H97]EKV43514.1 hypothetical protein AGABI2DRAFT_210273 [Agaricus bisporus var. bisporus H97]